MNTQSTSRGWASKLGVFLLVSTLTTLGIYWLRPRSPATSDRAPAPKAPADGQDALAALNDGFRSVYRQYRTNALADLGPVILVEGDDLVLLHAGRRAQVTTVPPRYHALKAITHVPLASYLLLKPVCSEGATQHDWEQVRAYRQRLTTVLEALAQGQVLRDELDTKLIGLLGHWRGLLDDALARKAMDVTRLTREAKRSAPLVLESGAEAARLQIEGLDRQVQAWRAQVSEADWQRLRVVVIGSQMPRKGNLNVQYFAKLLGQPGESSRIIYAEALWEEERALTLLGTHVVDTEIGAAFFGDDRRMHRDLLSDAAEAYLRGRK